MPSQQTLNPRRQLECCIITGTLSQLEHCIDRNNKPYLKGRLGFIDPSGPRSITCMAFNAAAKMIGPHLRHGPAYLYGGFDEQTFRIIGRAEVPAEVHSDDHRLNARFNAADFLESATDKELLALAGCGWRNDYPADAVAQHFAASHSEIALVLNYVCATRNMGFECSVDQTAALAWLAAYRPDIMPKLQDQLAAEDL